MLKILLYILIFISSPCFAQDKIDLTAWAQLPVLHEGRLKPIDSFARVHLKKFSNHESIEGMKAHEWLAKTIFTPEDAALIPAFKIRDFKDYELPERANKTYSYIEVTAALEKQKPLIDSLLQSNQKEWTPAQQELVETYNNAQIYAQLLRSLTAILPLNTKEEGQNYLTLKNKQHDPKTKNMLTLLEIGGSNNTYFTLAPEDWNNTQDNWISPWQATKTDHKEHISFLTSWSKLANAYREVNPAQWNKNLENISNLVPNKPLKVEYFYNVFKFLTLATSLYFITCICVVINNGFNIKIFEKTALYSLILGGTFNALDIFLRIYILSRPPVGTLYESIIFVSLICVTGFLLIEKVHTNQTGLLLGGISGALLLTAARSFTGDDTMNTLVAVLNTNFWLLTHVICITIGYAVCFLASLMAHYYLTVRAWKPSKIELLKQLNKGIKTLSIFALLFTAIGTILGGIWADQSWGRFWGWDPKENGALLIVLWLIWLLHSRITKHLNEIGFMIGTAFLSVIVVLAWFGINLLNVGLHSYGFISGVALSISTFCVFECLLIGTLYYLNRQKASKA